MLIPEVNIMWFRRDLRLYDNAALYHALLGGRPVVAVFIFDKNILDKLENKTDSRVNFIHKALLKMQEQLVKLHSTLFVFHDSPLNAWKQITRQFNVKQVYTNHDYEPYARERDKLIEDYCKSQGIQFSTYKDQVIFEKSEVCKDDGSPYTVFTPYMNRFRSKMNDFYLSSYPCEKNYGSFLKGQPENIATQEALGFIKTETVFPSSEVDDQLIIHYDKHRNIPSLNATSHLSVHLRFGTVSIRQLMREKLNLNHQWINELIWREFYMMILWHFPHVVNKPFKPAYEYIKWQNNEEEFLRWCKGITGYPIVDAGMRQLNETGFMHNRLRMITASFLTKHLLIDWRWGEAYFAQKLLDFDLAANNGGWQWAAGCGTDAAPYFRIFNPEEQTKRFDPDYAYIKMWVNEFNTADYPQPMVDHKTARQRCLQVYANALKQENRFA